jgi:pimeloyl-ACP methyl ester carboxylesterase
VTALPRCRCGPAPARRIDGVNGLSVHLLEAGFDAGPRPLLLLLHGFPELAYSWRRVMPALADAGFHVVAPDLRGYGAPRAGRRATTPTPADVHVFNLVRDQLALLHALGRSQVHAVVGHDFGSPLAAWCALVRPDVFRAVVLMSAPFAGPPGWAAGASRRPRCWTRSWPRCRARAATTSTTTPRARPKPRCCTARTACTTSCAPTTTSRAPTGRTTTRGRCRP